MIKSFTGRRSTVAFQRAVASGLTHVSQIRRIVRYRGTWFITCEVPA